MFIATLRKDIADDAIDVHGPHGFTLELHVEGTDVYLHGLCQQTLGALRVFGELLEHSVFTEWVVKEYERLTGRDGDPAHVG